MWVTATCSLIALTAVAAAACGDSDGAQVSASCGAFDGFDSYRYSISVKMQVQDLQPAPGATPGTALDAYADSLAALLSDFNIEGAYVAPDRRQAVLDFKGDQVELREVGEQRWERSGDDSWEQLASGSPTIEDLSPKLICTDLVESLAPGLARSASEEADINGVRAQRYSIDEANVDRLGALLGLEQGAELPAQFYVDVWFASDGDWPVRLDIRSQTAVAQVGAGAVRLVMELRDVNDPGITIEAPAGATGG